MAKYSPLDNPTTAQIAWNRYRRLMRWMTILSVTAVVVALGVLRWMMGSQLSIHMIIATAAGIGLSIMLAAALMGLVFLSSGSGHDESIEDRLSDEDHLK